MSTYYLPISYAAQKVENLDTAVFTVPDSVTGEDFVSAVKSAVEKYAAYGMADHPDYSDDYDHIETTYDMLMFIASQLGGDWTYLPVYSFVSVGSEGRIISGGAV